MLVDGFLLIFWLCGVFRQMICMEIVENYFSKKYKKGHSYTYIDVFTTRFLRLG